MHRFLEDLGGKLAQHKSLLIKVGSSLAGAVVGAVVGAVISNAIDEEVDMITALEQEILEGE